MAATDRLQVPDPPFPSPRVGWKIAHREGKREADREHNRLLAAPFPSLLRVTGPNTKTPLTTRPEGFSIRGLASLLIRSCCPETGRRCRPETVRRCRPETSRRRRPDDNSGGDGVGFDVVVRSALAAGSHHECSDDGAYQ